MATKLTTDIRKLAIAALKIALSDDEVFRKYFKVYSHSKADLKGYLTSRATDIYALDHLIGSLKAATKRGIEWTDEAYESINPSRLTLKHGTNSIAYRLEDLGYTEHADPLLSAAIMSYNFEEGAF